LCGAADLSGNDSGEVAVRGDGSNGAEPGGGIGGVVVVVVEVDHYVGVGVVAGADWVGLLKKWAWLAGVFRGEGERGIEKYFEAPVAHNVGVGFEGGELGLWAREEAVIRGAVAEVVGLVGGVASVAENDHGGDWKG
jgi:hypothetical protein